MKKILSNPTPDIKQLILEFEVLLKPLSGTIPQFKEALEFSSQHKLNTLMDVPGLDVRLIVERTFRRLASVADPLMLDLLNAFPDLDLHGKTSKGETAFDLLLKVKTDKATDLYATLVSMDPTFPNDKDALFLGCLLNKNPDVFCDVFLSLGSPNVVFNKVELGRRHIANICIALCNIDPDVKPKLLQTVLSHPKFNYKFYEKMHGSICVTVLTVHIPLNTKEKLFSVILSQFEKTPDTLCLNQKDISALYHFCFANPDSPLNARLEALAVKNPNTWFGIYGRTLDFLDKRADGYSLEQEQLFFVPFQPEGSRFFCPLLPVLPEDSFQENAPVSLKVSLPIILEMMSNEARYNSALSKVEASLESLLSPQLLAELNSHFSSDKLSSLPCVKGPTAPFPLYVPEPVDEARLIELEKLCLVIISALSRFLKQTYNLDLYAVSGLWDPSEANKVLSKGALFYEAQPKSGYLLIHGSLVHLVQFLMMFSELNANAQSAKRLISDFLVPCIGDSKSNVGDTFLDAKISSVVPNRCPEGHNAYILKKPGLMGNIFRLFHETLLNRQLSQNPHLSFESILLRCAMNFDAFFYFEPPFFEAWSKVNFKSTPFLGGVPDGGYKFSS